MAKFKNVYTDISTVNGGNQFGNEPMSANAINVALQNTQALKNGTTSVGKAESATNATNATNAENSNRAIGADCISGENLLIQLGTFANGKRRITSSGSPLASGDKILYANKWYDVQNGYVVCQASDPIAQSSSDVKFTVKKSVQSKGLWVFDKEWTDVAADSTYTVETNGTYQIIVQDDYRVVQAIVQVLGGYNYYLLGSIGEINSDGGSLIRFYQAEVRNGKLHVGRTRIKSLSEMTLSETPLAFRIRKIG